MKLVKSKNILKKEIDDKIVIVDLNTYRPYILNITANRVLDYFKRPSTCRKVIEKISKEYNVSYLDAKKDISNIVTSLKSKGLLKNSKQER